MWYPSEAFLVEAHDIMIRRFGGWTGFEVGLNPYRRLLEEVKAAEGLYRKAALLLLGVCTRRIFQDGNHRTAYEVTKTFLEMNGAEMKEKNLQKVIRFIKDIRNYNLKQIECWLENGTTM